jgi:hypothetical protein
MKIAGSGSGSVSQRHGSANPDPYQNVSDPQHCILKIIISISKCYNTRIQVLLRPRFLNWVTRSDYLTLASYFSDLAKDTGVYILV